MPAASPLNIVAIGFDSEDDGHSLWGCTSVQPRWASPYLCTLLLPLPRAQSPVSWLLHRERRLLC